MTDNKSNLKKYILGYTDEHDFLVLFANEADADFNSEEWCAVYAESLEQAKEQYETSFQEWKSRNS